MTTYQQLALHCTLAAHDRKICGPAGPVKKPRENMVRSRHQSQPSAELGLLLLLVLAQYVTAGEISVAVPKRPFSTAPYRANHQLLLLGSHYRTGTVRSSDHFVVWTGRYLCDAEWTLQVLEEAWHDISQLSEHWTSAHHTSKRMHHPIPVVVDAPRHPQPSSESTQFAVQNGKPMIYINTAIHQPPLLAQTEVSRATAVKSLLHTTDQARWLPVWAYHGLVEYVSRNDEQRKTSFATDHSWFEFLLYGADSIYAVELFESLKQASQNLTAPLQTRPKLIRNVSRVDIRQPIHHAEIAAHRSLDALRRRPDIQAAYRAWTQNSNHQLPDFQPNRKLSQPLQHRQQEMVLILKLLRRFQGTLTNTIAFTGQQLTPPADTKPALGLSTLNDDPTTLTDDPTALDRLYARLTDNNAPAWATRDIDGTLLLSHQKRRIDKLFAMNEGRYQVIRHDGRFILLNHWKADFVLAGWLAGRKPEAAGTTDCKGGNSANHAIKRTTWQQSFARTNELRDGRPSTTDRQTA